MIDIAKLKVGDKVHYQPEYYTDAEYQNGRIKEIIEGNLTYVSVVYNCNSDWKNYTNYTSELTRIQDLKLGWRH